MTSQKTREEEQREEMCQFWFERGLKQGEIQGITLGKAQAIEDEILFLQDLLKYWTIYNVKSLIEIELLKLKEIK